MKMKNEEMNINHYSLLTTQYKMKHGFGQFCPKAVLFDMDGVIYDSMPNHATSWHQAMADFGLDMPLCGAYEYEGMRGVETIKILAQRQWGRTPSDDEAQNMYAHKSEIFATCKPAELMPGIKELMEQIKSCGLKICVVTDSAQHVLLDKLEEDLHNLVSKELMVTAFDVKHGKPAPEPYLKGMEKCGVNPWEAIVVENAPLGVRAAVAAQCFTIAVNTGPLPDEKLSQEGANLIFPRMTALSEDWKKLMECI
jgi:HAD superfamily hydrolase (TIGR01509 family)